MQDTRSIVSYYADLLNMQYVNKVKARATIEASADAIVMPQKSKQTLNFRIDGEHVNSALPGYSGNYKLKYKTNETPAIPFASNAAYVQGQLRTLTGYPTLTVTGTVETEFLVSFNDNLVSADLLVVSFNDIFGPGALPVTIQIEETDPILPLAVQSAFNILPGFDFAEGVQLDIIGKYVGVSRNGRGFGSFITLTDEEFILLIRAAIARNSLGSSLDDIQTFLFNYFPEQIFVYDYDNMHLGYFIAPGVVSSNLLQIFIGQRLLPKPMAVSIYPIIYSLTDELLFGFNTYTKVNTFASPFNSYAAYSQNVTWLSYSFIVTI